MTNFLQLFFRIEYDIAHNLESFFRKYHDDKLDRWVLNIN